MKWEMEIDEIEAVLEKIWDLHDKLSDAIHSISRAHFLSTVKNHGRRKRSDDDVDDERKSGSGYVYVKGEYRVDDDEPAVHEAKSLYSIRTALENLEDQLDFFHTVQTQQRAERDAAIARLEQSRIILAMRLAEHQGKKYKVIEEALALVGDVRDASRFVSPEHLYNDPSGQNSDTIKGDRPNPLLKFFLSGFTLVSKSIKLDHTVGILGNAALLAISMIAFVSLNQLGCKEKYEFDDRLHGRETRSVSRLKGTISGDVSHLDVKLARG